MESTFLNLCTSKGLIFNLKQLNNLNFLPVDTLHIFYNFITLIEWGDINDKNELIFLLEDMYIFTLNKSNEVNISKHLIFGTSNYTYEEIINTDESHLVWLYASNKLYLVEYLRDHFYFDHVAEIYRFCVQVLIELLFISSQSNIEKNKVNYFYWLIFSKLFVTHLRYELDFLKQSKFF